MHLNAKVVVSKHHLLFQSFFVTILYTNSRYQIVLYLLLFKWTIEKYIKLLELEQINYISDGLYA